jgi:hypothetical protein
MAGGMVNESHRQNEKVNSSRRNSERSLSKEYLQGWHAQMESFNRILQACILKRILDENEKAPGKAGVTNPG